MLIQLYIDVHMQGKRGFVGTRTLT